MRKWVPIVAGLGLLGIASTAQAMPLSASPEPEAGVIKVAGGCGPGWHPNPWGRCVPFRRWGGPPPGFYGRPHYWRGGPGYWRGGPGWRHRW